MELLAALGGRLIFVASSVWWIFRKSQRSGSAGLGHVDGARTRMPDRV